MTINYTVTVGGTDVSHILAPSTFQITDQLDGRNTCQFTTKSNSNSFVGVVGNNVQVTKDGVVIYAGIVTDIVGMQLGDPSPISGWDYTYKCADYTTLASRHLVAFNYENMSADDIVIHLVTYFMAGEGVTAVKAASGGYVHPGVVLSSAVFNYIPVSQALDQLAQQCGYSWFIDYNKNLCFFDRTTYTAPFSLTDTKYNYTSLTTEKTQQDYRNRQWMQGGTQLSNQRTEYFIGDGKATSFDLQYTCATTPTIKVNNVLQTVGILNVDQNKAWYWSDKSATITQAKTYTAFEDYCSIKYDFSESSGTTLKNKAPNAVLADAATNDCDYRGVSSGAGYWRFDDTTDVVFIGHQTTVDNVREHTFEWIIYLGSFTGQPNQRLFDKTGGSTRGYCIYIDNTNHNLVIQRFTQGGGAYALYTTPANTFTASNRYHIQVEWDCSVVNSVPTVIVNDVPQTLTSGGSGTVIAWDDDSGYDVYIGNDPTHQRWFDGGFYLFRMWRTAKLSTPSLPSTPLATALLTRDQLHTNYLAEMWRYTASSGQGTPITSNQKLAVTYQYRFPIVDYVQSTSEQTTQATKEGTGTGVYEAIQNDGTLTSVAAALQEANALLTKYMITPETITFYTFTAGLQAGQLLTINLPELGINSTYLIESVALKDVDFVIGEYEVVALSGQTHTWSDYFKDMTKQGQTYQIGSGDTLLLASVNNINITTNVSISQTNGTPHNLATTNATVGFSECRT